MDYAKLSKQVSHALRHAPDEYGLTLDADGWVAVSDLLGALKALSPDWESLAESDLQTMIQRSAKQRHELSEGRIRALYGHSTSDRIAKEGKRPPVFLYHGTDPTAAAAILQEGLKPMGRQYVHLSLDENTAREVGRRKDAQPAILLVRAVEAFETGVAFYEGNQSIWLADLVPSRFISIISGGNA
jgi:putative RNA 2'-phosphotransferase